MLPGGIAQPLLDKLAWALLIGVVPLMLVAWGFTLKVSMSEEKLQQIQAAIRQRASVIQGEAV